MTQSSNAQLIRQINYTRSSLLICLQAPKSWYRNRRLITSARRSWLVSRESRDRRQGQYGADPSDGFILTQAYNSAVLSSPKAWGFIPAEDIHDTLQSNMDQDDAESKAEKEWTFRKVGNLTFWAA